MNNLVKLFVSILLLLLSSYLYSKEVDSIQYKRIVDANTEKEELKSKLKAAKLKNNSLEVIESYFGLGASYQLLGYYDSSQTFFDSALRAIKTNNNKPYSLFIDALKRSGDNLMFKGDFIKAINKYDEVIKLESGKPKSRYTGAAYKSMAAVYQKMGNYSKALEYGLKSLDIAESRADKAEIANVANEIGIIYKQLKYYDKAITFLKKSITIKEEQNNEIGLTSSYLNLGSVYSRQENYGLAKEYFNKSLQLKTKLGIIKGVSAIYTNIGLIHKRKKEYEKAEGYYFKALEIAKKTKNKNYQFNALNNLASLYLEVGKPDKAKKYGKESLVIAENTGSKYNMLFANYNLYEAYTLTGDYEKALEHYVEFNKNEDSITSKKAIAKIERLEKELALKEKDKELELSNLKQDLSRSRNVMVIVTLVMVVLLLTVLLYFKNKQNKIKLNTLATEKSTLQLAHQQIEQKLRYEKLSKEHYLAKLENQELQTSTKSLEVGKLEKDIEKLKSQLISNKTKENKSLAETIVLLGKSEKDWTLFMNYFQEVYHDFHKNLISDYPNLTPHELRLCALLKINLTTKEIADILNISPASLRTSKYRLRKKLQLAEDVNVQEFILKY